MGKTPRLLSTGSSPRRSLPSSEDGEELVKVTLDLQDDNAIVDQKYVQSYLLHPFGNIRCFSFFKYIYLDIF
jgi:hypothetical protein